MESKQLIENIGRDKESREALINRLNRLNETLYPMDGLCRTMMAQGVDDDLNDVLVVFSKLIQQAFSEFKIIAQEMEGQS